MKVTSSVLGLILIVIAAIPSSAQNISRSPIQTVYRNGVPHTDKNGKPLMQYDPDRSFFQIGMWGTPLHGMTLGHNYDWQVLKQAGFNTAWTWYKPADESLRDGDLNDMQVVLMGAYDDATLQAIRDNPAHREHLLGNVWHDEPTTLIAPEQMQTYFDEFQAYRQNLRAILPDTPVFVTDAPAYANNATQRQWWLDWASAGDLTNQDNYPITALNDSSIGKVSGPPGVPEGISLAASNYGEQKPVWALVGAFGDNGPDDSPHSFRFPTPRQLRAQVYTALIHGATGISYFIWDSYISREAHIVGISPNPVAEGYTQPGGPYNDIATPEQLAKSVELWNAVASVNAELQELAPAILSPTVAEEELAYALQIRNLSAANDPDVYALNPIRTLLKHDPAGGYILLLANLDDRSMDVSMQFSEAMNFDLLFEDDNGFFGQLGMADQFTWHIEPFASHVFHLSVPEPSSAVGMMVMAAALLWRHRETLPSPLKGERTG